MKTRRNHLFSSFLCYLFSTLEHVLTVHRQNWSRKQINELRSFLVEVTETKTALAGGTGKRATAKLEERAATAWVQAGSVLL